eukprot:gnl/Ergobibamus_cyprinoides/900.p1 GENE.gnl/Ergobibamus_cyprinoides/900~~gnl/Ergobibamus_cyprinoides/900.p1  ORF type:complete len:134 (-),score=9.47 gnl/Ergobibamus_cyprinoides/900:91-465(-)
MSSSDSSSKTTPSTSSISASPSGGGATAGGQAELVGDLVVVVRDFLVLAEGASLLRRILLDDISLVVLELAERAENDVTDVDPDLLAQSCRGCDPSASCRRSSEPRDGRCRASSGRDHTPVRAP